MVTGEQIKRARERAGMSQRDLARAISASRTTVSNWETGQASPRNKLGRVLEVLNIGPDGLPAGESVIDADLRATPVPDLVALQGRITAEFARRLGQLERRPDNPATGMAVAAYDATAYADEGANPRRKA